MTQQATRFIDYLRARQARGVPLSPEEERLLMAARPLPIPPSPQDDSLPFVKALSRIPLLADIMAAGQTIASNVPRTGVFSNVPEVRPTVRGTMLGPIIGETVLPHPRDIDEMSALDFVLMNAGLKGASGISGAEPILNPAGKGLGRISPVAAPKPVTKAAKDAFTAPIRMGMASVPTEGGGGMPRGIPKVIEPNDIHKLADDKKVVWDEDPAFLEWSKAKTGEARIDQMDQAQRQTLYDALERGERPGVTAPSEPPVPKPPAESPADAAQKLSAQGESPVRPEVKRFSKVVLRGYKELSETVSPIQAMRLRYGETWKGTPAQARAEAKRLWPDRFEKGRISIMRGSLLDEDRLTDLGNELGTDYLSQGREAGWDQLLSDIGGAAKARKAGAGKAEVRAEIKALERQRKMLTPIPTMTPGIARDLPTTLMGEPRLPEPHGLPPVTGGPQPPGSGPMRPRLPEARPPEPPLTGRGGPPIPPGGEGLPGRSLIDVPVTNPGPTPLRDIRIQARGIGGMPPAGRAVVGDLSAPIEGQPGYVVGDFDAPGRRLMKQSTDPIHQVGDDKRAFQEIEKAKARAWTQAWGSRALPAFGFKRGVATAVEGSPDIFQIIEHPADYRFTPEQQSALGEARDVLKRMVRDEQRSGVDVRELEHIGYWPRIVRSGPGETWRDTLKAIVTGERPATSGGKGHTRGRVFEFADELKDAGFKLEQDPLIALESRLSAGIDAISVAKAKDRLKAMPGFEMPSAPGRVDADVVALEREARAALDEARENWRRQPSLPQHAEALDRAEAAWELTLRDLGVAKETARQPRYNERQVLGLIAPKELVQKVERYVELPGVQRGGSAAGAIARDTQTLARSMLTSLDLSAGFIQGQSLFFRNNVAWWKAQGYAVVSLVKEPSGYVARNLDDIKDGIDHGAINPPAEYLFASRGIASLPKRIPVAGPVLKAANRAFEWFIFVGQTELYRAARTSGGVVKGEKELVSLGSAIRKQMGTESYAIKGVRPTQQALEALTFFAPRFMRANIGLMGQAFTKGPGGNEARKAMGALLAGGMALTVAASWATDRKMPNLDDPFKDDWLQFRIGKSHFNMFGPFYSYFRALARSGTHLAQGEPKKAATDQARFLESKLGIPYRLADTVADVKSTGRSYTYEGDKITMDPRTYPNYFKTLAPISASGAVQGAMEGRPEEALGFSGLTVRKANPLSGLRNDWRKDVSDYQKIPTNPREAKAKGRLNRTDFRKRNPEVDAKLFILGYVDSLASPGAQARSLRLMRQHRITTADIESLKASEYESAEHKALRQAIQRGLGEKATQTQKSAPQAATPTRPGQYSVPYVPPPRGMVVRARGQ